MKLPLFVAAQAAAIAPASANSAPVVAVLPLAAADSGMPYGLLPSRSELAIMNAELRAGLRAGGVALADPRRVESRLAAAGFDQTSPDRACVVPACAQRIGRAARADRIVVGAVTRMMAVIWGTTFSIVDVRTGNVLDEFKVGYKGDVQAMELGQRDAGACLARLLEHKKPCPPDPGW